MHELCPAPLRSLLLGVLRAAEYALFVWSEWTIGLGAGLVVCCVRLIYF